MKRIARWILPALLATGAGAAATLGQDDSPAPLESGDVGELTLLNPPGTRIEYFRLDLAPQREPEPEPEERAGEPAVLDASAREPVGVLRWISGPETAPDGRRGLRLETETTLFDVATRVIHTETLLPDERKLVYREVREREGRTVLLESRSPAAGVVAELRVSETMGGVIHRREPDATGGVLLPLYLLENVRSGASFRGEFALFLPLSAEVELLTLDTLLLPVADGPPRGGAVAAGADEEGTTLPPRELRLHRGDGLFAGAYRFEGADLVGFRWQAGGVSARAIDEEEYRRWLRLNPRDQGH